MNKWRHCKCTARDGWCRSMRKLNFNSSEWRHTKQKDIRHRWLCRKKGKHIRILFCYFIFSFYFIHSFFLFIKSFGVRVRMCVCACVCAPGPTIRLQPGHSMYYYLESFMFYGQRKQKGKKFSVRYGLNVGAIFMFLIYLPVNCTHFRNFFMEYLRFRYAFPFFRYRFLFFFSPILSLSPSLSVSFSHFHSRKALVIFRPFFVCLFLLLLRWFAVQFRQILFDASE